MGAVLGDGPDPDTCWVLDGAGLGDGVGAALVGDVGGFDAVVNVFVGTTAAFAVGVAADTTVVSRASVGSWRPSPSSLESLDEPLDVEEAVEGRWDLPLEDVGFVAGLGVGRTPGTGCGEGVFCGGLL